MDNEAEKRQHELWEQFRCNHEDLNRAIDDGKWAEAMPDLRSLTAGGDVCAETILGTCLWLGLGIEKDTQAAVAMLRNAAERGNALAAHNLSSFYMTGDEEVEQDLGESMRFRDLATLLGSPFWRENVDAP